MKQVIVERCTNGFVMTVIEWGKEPTKKLVAADCDPLMRVAKMMADVGREFGGHGIMVEAPLLKGEEAPYREVA